MKTPLILWLIITFCTILVLGSLSSPQWGTFRPHALISARAAVPHSPYFGFAYHPANSLDVRHLTTENHDKIKLISWTRHDGSFGDQDIHDEDANLLITSHFLAHPTQPSACVLRVTAVPLDPNKPVSPISLVFYAVAGPEDIDPSMASDMGSSRWGSLRFDGINSHVPQRVTTDVRILGNASTIGGAFTFRVHRPRFGMLTSLVNATPGQRSGLSSRSLQRTSAGRPPDDDTLYCFHISSPSTTPESAWAIERHLRRVLRRRLSQERTDVPLYFLDGSVSDSSSATLVQHLLGTPFELDATFVLTENRDTVEVEQIENDLIGSSLDIHLQNARDAFDKRFEHVFKLREKGVTADEIAFGQTTLSNVMGGIGYFYGSSIAKEGPEASREGIKKPGFLQPVGLLTATPSRATFPRGFLWDEGFHQLIIQRWDSQLSQRCVESWFKAIQENGWIPREQILGHEARMRFPQHVQHLMIQNPRIANPPTILMPLRLLAAGLTLRNRTSSNANETRSERDKNGDQKCCSMEPVKGTMTQDMLRKAERYYAWLRDSQSGERRDSFRWRGRSEEERSPDGYPLTLASGLDDYPRVELPNDGERHVDLHCWMTWACRAIEELADRLGEDSFKYKLEYERLKKSLAELHGTPVSKNSSNREDLLLCDFDGDQKVCHEGYVTILPLVLGILDPFDERLSVILDSLEDPELLRARGGLRSLSKSSKWYRKGDDYWTGSIWMPFNFLTLAALKTRYSVEEGPYRDRAKKVYANLKTSILENTFQVFSKTGQLWENYSPDEDGTGKSGRQFTGWSALILLMYAEMFDGVV